jgi:hypothetical protein
MSLEQFDNVFNTTPADDGTEPPDGEYDATIEKSEMQTTKSSGKPKWFIMFRIEGPEQAGRCLFLHDVVQEKSLGRIKHNAHLLGLKLAKFSDLYTKAGDAIGLKVKVTKSTNTNKDTGDTYTNVKIGGLLGAPIPTNDEIPF